VVCAPAPVATAQQPVQQAVEQPAEHHHREEELPEVYIYSHSMFFYWWPVWLTGYIMALITYLNGKTVEVSPGTATLIHPSKNLGVTFTIIFFLVIIITHVTMRGASSLVAILAAAVGVLLLAYFGWWEVVLGWLGNVYIFMNVTFYWFFATLVFLVWAFSFFIYDRLAYWRVRPGQITHERVIGGAEKSYDTRGMVFEKHREDLFRHWVLGIGSGDIQISTMGARRENIYVPNVLFINTKVNRIQEMIAMKPTEFAPPVQA
jgi:hypothetical protein